MEADVSLFNVWLCQFVDRNVSREVCLQILKQASYGPVVRLLGCLPGQKKAARAVTRIAPPGG